MSTRYKDLVETIDREIIKRGEYAEQLLLRYGEDVEKLGEFTSYIAYAFDTLENKKLTKRAQAALALLAKHVKEYRDIRRLDSEKWRHDFQQRFKDLAD